MRHPSPRTSRRLAVICCLAWVPGVCSPGWPGDLVAELIVKPPHAATLTLVPEPASDPDEEVILQDTRNHSLVRIKGASEPFSRHLDPGTYNIFINLHHKNVLFFRRRFTLTSGVVSVASPASPSGRKDQRAEAEIVGNVDETGRHFAFRFGRCNEAARALDFHDEAGTPHRLVVN